MMTFAVLLAAVVTAASAAPKAEIRNVRISSPKILVSREKAESDVIVGGQIHVDMSFARKMVRKPVLRLVCLCEVDGALSVYTVFLDKLRTNEGMSRSDIQAAFRNAGVEIPLKDCETAWTDPAKFTPHLPEVTREGYAAAVYGTPDLKRGFMRLGRSRALPKVLLFRCELWQNGVCAAVYESSRAGLGSYEIPTDWHCWKKHQQKFKYADIR